MLYDPKWEQPTKTDPLSLETLIAWLETKDPAEEYNWCDCLGRCLYSQYLTHLGYPSRPDDPITKPVWIALHEKFMGQIILGDNFTDDTTFGAALERARRSLPSTVGATDA